MTMLQMLHDEGHAITALSVNYHQPHVQEIEWARWHARRLNIIHHTIEIPELGGLTKESWIVPNRNAILLSLAVNMAIIAKADTVTIGCNADDADYFPDCRAGFICTMNEAVISAGYEIEICAPFIDWPKWKIGALAKEMGIKVSEIWSCYEGGAKPCGKCPACLKLEAALK